MTRGKFITLEGLDGAGKSTHLEWLRIFLESRGVPVCITREPGGTPLGEALRTLLLDREQRSHPETETLLMFAARREHLDKVILPALETGAWVVCDRFTDASYAYQSGGSGVEWQKIACLEAWVHPDLQPDLTFYFDVNPEIGRARARSVRTADRYEQEEQGFHARVRAAYLCRASEQPARMHVIDASGAVNDVQEKLEKVLLSLWAKNIVLAEQGSSH